MSCICSDERPCAMHAFRTLEILRIKQTPEMVRRLQDSWPEFRAQYGRAIYEVG
jgi:hypothetical protein